MSDEFLPLVAKQSLVANPEMASDIDVIITPYKDGQRLLNPNFEGIDIPKDTQKAIVGGILETEAGFTQPVLQEEPNPVAIKALINTYKKTGDMALLAATFRKYGNLVQDLDPLRFLSETVIEKRLKIRDQKKEPGVNVEELEKIDTLYQNRGLFLDWLYVKFMSL